MVCAKHSDEVSAPGEGSCFDALLEGCEAKVSVPFRVDENFLPERRVEDCVPFLANSDTD